MINIAALNFDFPSQQDKKDYYLAPSTLKYKDFGCYKALDQLKRYETKAQSPLLLVLDFIFLEYHQHSHLQTSNPNPLCTSLPNLFFFIFNISEYLLALLKYAESLIFILQPSPSPSFLYFSFLQSASSTRFYSYYVSRSISSSLPAHSVDIFLSLHLLPFELERPLNCPFWKKDSHKSPDGEIGCS